ncbi:MAG: AMIN domain-containing protein [Desulfurivibrionaceae bacterium]|nr:AMIN domain-containing protein [Desulfurivibrionaceae bacterium]
MTPVITRLKCISAGLMIFCFLVTGTTFAQKTGSQTKAAYTISGITLDQTADGLQLVVQGGTPPTYTMYELFDPLRIVLDIADARLLDSTAIPVNLPQGPVQEIKNIALTDQDPAIARLEIYLSDDPAYTIERKGNNIVVSFAKTMPLAAHIEQAATEPEQQPAPAVSPQSHPASMLEDIEIDTTNPAETRVFIKTNGPITDFQKAHLVKRGALPARMYIDIANVVLPGKMLQHTVGTALGKIRAAQRNSAVRIVFDSGLKELFTYELENRPDGLLVKIAEPSAPMAAPVVAGIMKHSAPPNTTEARQPETKMLPAQPQPAHSLSAAELAPPAASAPAAPVQEAIAPELIVPKFASTAKAKPKSVAAKPSPEPKTAKGTASAPSQKASEKTAKADSFAFAGYEKQKITVDFFKIDLHNVFRLFGEISGQNIVVDEGVSGTLTLALNDIPWDFALDIILNLKELQKEERFNTIVISPKTKQFHWPKAATEAVSIKGGERIEAISVKQRLETPKGVVEAKTLIQQATAAEKNGQPEKALALYESAFANWPENAQLASRIASLCLTQLGLNAKAVHYAKATLTLEPANAEAALQAAIGSANMKKTEAAKTYFDLAISGDTPSSEALISYASFAEEYQSYNGALALLDRHEALFGDTLDTLVAKARILDKLGHSAQAVAAYNAILLSGYAVPEDLRQFIKGRVAAAN